MQPGDLTADRRDRARVEQRVLGLIYRHAVHLVQAQVVAPALEDGEDGLAAEQLRQRRGEPRQVALDELALQRDGGGRDDHGAAVAQRVPRRRDEVGQRFPGASSGLDRQVLPGLLGLLHGGRHGDLSRPLRAADAGHRGVEQDVDVGKVGGHERHVIACRPRRGPAASGPVDDRMPTSGRAMAAGASVRLMNRGTGFALVAAAAAVTAAAAMRWWDQSNKVIQGPEWTASYRRFTELGPWYDLTEHVNGKP